MLQLILAIVAVGVLLYCINRWVPMEGNIKTILNWVVIIALIILLLNVFGVFAWLSHFDVPRIDRR